MFRGRTLTLFFPSKLYYKCNAKDEEDLNKIILDTDNWVYFETNTGSPITIADEKDQIHDIHEYYTSVTESAGLKDSKDLKLSHTQGTDLEKLVEALKKSLPKNFTGYSVWYNPNLGASERKIKVTSFWYGDKPSPGVATVTLLLPTAREYYCKEANTEENLKKIILTPDNWKPLEINEEKLKTSMHDSFKLESVESYIKYLNDNYVTEFTETVNIVTVPVKRGRDEPTESMEEKEEKTPVRRGRISSSEPIAKKRSRRR